jgi:gliding motility-associated lipoprotein GldH
MPIAEAMKQKATLLLLSAVTLLSITSCDPKRLYETNTPIADQKWSYNDVKTYTVDVTDTTTRYNIYINIRHSFQFDWRNLYVQVGTQLPDGKKLEKRVNLPLCEPDGKWYGSCMGDNCDIPVMIQHDAIFPMVGRYTFTIRQDMRANPLDKIKSVGLRVEKAVAATAAN